MRSTWLGGALALLLLIPGRPGAAGPPDAGAPATPAPAEGEVEWSADYPMGLQEALLLRRPVLLTFSTGWCGWCRRLERTTFQDPRFVDLARQMVALQVDAEKQPALAQLFRVRGYPTTVILDRRGKEIGRIVGYQPAEPFVAGLMQALGRREPLDAVEKRAEAAPDDPEAQYALGDALLAVGRCGQAEAAFARVPKLVPGVSTGLVEDAALDLAVAHLFDHDYEGALPLFRAYLKRYPKGDRRDQGLFFYGLALAGSGRRQEGLAQIRKAAETTSYEYIKHEARRLESLVGDDDRG